MKVHESDTQEGEKQIIDLYQQMENFCIKHRLFDNSLGTFNYIHSMLLGCHQAVTNGLARLSLNRHMTKL